MIKKFKSLKEFNEYTNNRQWMKSGEQYWIEDQGQLYFLTNNIDGETKTYEMMDEIPEGYIVPTGNKEITANGTNIDIAQYATATVNVQSSPTEFIDLIERDITSINIPSGVTNIGNSAFAYCSSITSITIPNGVTNIGNSAFASCNSLTSITIPNGVTKIGNSAFASCNSLTSITIPNGVTSIGISAFQNCTQLNTVVLNGGGVIGGTNYYDSGVFTGCGNLTSVTIGNGVTTLGNRCFDSCSNANFNSIVIPNSVTTIGQYAFQNCSYLSSVTIGNGITNIDQQAFVNCARLTSLTINATTPPTLGANALIGTNANLIIYVPAESVDAYKAATNWSSYADKIQAISAE